MIQLNTLPQQKYSKLAEESIEIYIRKVTTDLSFQIHRLAIEKIRIYQNFVNKNSETEDSLQDNNWGFFKQLF
jgi:hypothetical protein